MILLTACGEDNLSEDKGSAQSTMSSEGIKKPDDADDSKYIKFGKYEQDNNEANGKEDIEWLVLEEKDGKLFLLSRYALDHKRYDTEDENDTWEKCTLRAWLNNEFINTAFTAKEKDSIITVTIPAEKRNSEDIGSENDTQDKVFLLSIDEADKYFESNTKRRCMPTSYAVANGVSLDSFHSKYCWYWLRSPAYKGGRAAAVGVGGSVVHEGASVDFDKYGVRPALWIGLNS